MANKSLEAHLYECLKEGNTKKALYIIELLGDDVNALYGAKSFRSWAKEFECEEVVKALDKKGVKEKVLSEAEYEQFIENLITNFDCDDEKCVENLLKKGVDINAKGKNGCTFLMEACRKGNVEVVDKLIKAGANINQKDLYSCTALMVVAVYGGSVEIVDKLVKNGADLEVKDNAGWTALVKAFNCGNIEIAERLIKAGADINQRDKDGDTALIIACAKEDYVMIQKLIENGADVLIKNNNGMSALDVSSDNNVRVFVMDVLRKSKAKRFNVKIKPIVFEGY